MVEHHDEGHLATRVAGSCSTGSIHGRSGPVRIVGGKFRADQTHSVRFVIRLSAGPRRNLARLALEEMLGPQAPRGWKRP